MALYALSVSLGAFLLFLVQPMIGKLILPWFGGGPGVWTLCLLFFQTLLLAGYGYAHWLVRLPPRRQLWIHSILLVAAALALPITPAESSRPAPDGTPELQILEILIRSVGAPFFVLASTGPLAQAWFARVIPTGAPYRLYALSNTGSLAALIAYPFLVEPTLSMGSQASAWTLGYWLYAAVAGGSAWRFAVVSRLRAPDSDSPTDPSPLDTVVSRPGWLRIVTWMLLAMLASALLLASTNQITQDVAAVPFLWILPLGLYLLSFILCFDSERWYSPRLMAAASIVCGALAFYALREVDFASLVSQIAIHCAALFVACMVCHGELARRKPDPRFLTGFYLAVGAGGALGGLLVSTVAPILFDGFWEYPLGLAAWQGVVVAIWIRELAPEVRVAAGRGERLRAAIPLVISTGAACALGGWLVVAVAADRGIGAERVRNFFGVLRIENRIATESKQSYRSLLYGQILHGMQYLSDERRRVPTSYYSRDGGGGIAIDQHPARGVSDGSLRVGVIGLGVGTLAAYARPGDSFVFYEINPSILRLAHEYFSFMNDARARGAQLTVHLGDARLQLDAQLARGDPQRFHVLVVDAFSGDAIPVHLLTRESSELYWSHLRDDGILAIHTSNSHLDLGPVVRGLADLDGKTAVAIRSRDRELGGALSSVWWLVTSNARFLESRILERKRSSDDQHGDPVVWTDDFTSLLPVLR